jgi:ABC-2 type transport system permease protein
MTVAEEVEKTHVVPSDLAQLPIVWKYEILKYLRSRRLLAALAVVGVIVALIYALPPAFGEEYGGKDTGVQIYVIPTEYSDFYLPSIGISEYIGFINRSVVVSETLEMFIDGAPYPSNDGANWSFAPIEVEGNAMNIVFFKEDIGGHDITATYEWHISAETFDSNFIGFANILIVICAVAFAADSLVGEFQSRTGYLIFPNAIKRRILFLGKFSASMTMGIVIIALYYAVVAGLSAISAGGIDNGFGLSFAFAVEYVLATMAIAYLISSVLKGSTGAIVLTFFLLIMILPIVDGVSMVAGVKIEASLTFAAGTITYVLIDPYPTDTMLEVPGMGMDFHSFYPTPETAAVVMFAYAAIALVLSTVLFNRKQLAG